MNSIDVIDNYYDHYKLIKYADSNLEEPIELYHKWYDAALEIFSHYFRVGDRFYDKFTSVDNSGNGFLLYKNFAYLKGTYIVLSSRIKGNITDMNSDKLHNKNIVFIIHGHNEAVREKVARVVEKLGLDVIILNEQPNVGGTIIEKFEKNSSEADFAIVLLTMDDECKAKTDNEYRFRARQNVIFEMGYFMGRLSRSHVFILFEEGVEEPSDIRGIGYTPIKDGWEKNWLRN